MINSREVAAIGISSGWTLSEATGINDNGWILGLGINSLGQAGAFLLTPIPEPVSFVLLALGGAAGLIRCRHML